LYQRRDLSRAKLLAATSEQEVKDVRRRMPGKVIALVPNGVEIPEKPPTVDHLLSATDGGQRSPHHVPTRTELFLGRLHPVKGLENLIKSWHLVQPKGWRCILAGPDEAGHQRELQSLLKSCDLASSFEFPGMVEHDKKWALLRQADVFVLPSFTENFGISAAEALACGVPVIATKGTPWSDLAEHRCGWWIDIGMEPLAEALRQAVALPDTERLGMGRRGRGLIEEKYSWPKVASGLVAVYEWLLKGGRRPNCVNLAANG
jgi:glycosyltransferase involved in cell wall biosynthesis